MPDKNARAARAREALLARHAQLQAVLENWAGGWPRRPAAAHRSAWVQNLLLAFLTGQMLQPSRAEERTLYRAARH